MYWDLYYGPEGLLFSLTILFVFPQCFRTVYPENLGQFSKVSYISLKSQTVLGAFKLSLEIWNNSQKSQTVLRTLRHFSEVSNTPRKPETVLEVLNSTWKSQTVLQSVKYFSEVQNSFFSLKQILGSPKQFSDVSNKFQKSKTFFRSPKQFSDLPTTLGISGQFGSFRWLLSINTINNPLMIHESFPFDDSPLTNIKIQVERNSSHWSHWWPRNG